MFVIVFLPFNDASFKSFGETPRRGGVSYERSLKRNIRGLSVWQLHREGVRLDSVRRDALVFRVVEHLRGFQ